MYYGKFTHKSDVWGYGVTLWEIWTFGQLPYDDLTGREVLENIEKGQRLPQPSGCPDEVFKVGGVVVVDDDDNDTNYQVMRSCWEYIPDKRPTFSELWSLVQKLR